MTDVSDDIINSVKNDTSCEFSARSWSIIPDVSIEVRYIRERQSIESFTVRNNEIDHFDRR